MKPRLKCVLRLALFFGWLAIVDSRAFAADESLDLKAIRAAEEAFVKDFNAANSQAIAAQFLPQGELIDDVGNVYHGRQELQKLFTLYFAKFPGAKLDLNIESIRAVSDGLAIEEGTRSLSTQDGAKAQVRYVTFLTKTNGQWRIAATREFNDESAPSTDNRLAPLAWLVGDWISEAEDAAVKVSYRWDEDENFLLGEIQSIRNGKPLMKSTQRIGWDPLAEQIRSWMFDADGGFAEGTWTLLEDEWVIRSQATLPDGTSGTATLTIAPKGNDQFMLRGTERIVDGNPEEDFELTITRAPPNTRQTAAASPAVPPTASAAPVDANILPAPAAQIRVVPKH